MKLAELREIFEQELTPLYEPVEARQHFASLCEVYFGYSPATVVLRLQESVSAEDTSTFKHHLAQLKKYVPIQYIIGKVHFASLELTVNNSVLIPRPETEELVHWILTSFPENESLQVLDICTGSGCIALALKKARPNWNVTAWDIDLDALSTAQQNAKNNNVRVDFKQRDVFSKNLPEKKWDIVVSNPPYVPEALQKSTQPQVLKHEPQHAIFVSDNNPLCFYDRIFEYASQQLSQYGSLFFEGHAPLMESVKRLLQQEGFSDIVLRNDFRANQRFIHASKT